MAGCSIDTLEDQQEFARKQGFRFPLIADPDGELCRSFGVVNEEWGLAVRATTIIGEDGTVLKTFPDAPLDGKGHAQEVLDELKGLLS